MMSLFRLEMKILLVIWISFGYPYIASGEKWIKKERSFFNFLKIFFIF